jgi:hypothetical protein
VTDHIGTSTPVDDIAVAFLVPPDQPVGTTVTDQDVCAHAAKEVLNRDQLIDASTRRAPGGQVGDDRSAGRPEELHEVPTGTAIQHVIAGATEEPVLAGPAVEPIIARSSIPGGVIAVTTLDDIVADFTGQVITAPTSANPVVTTIGRRCDLGPIRPRAGRMAERGRDADPNAGTATENLVRDVEPTTPGGLDRRRFRHTASLSPPPEQVCLLVERDRR